MKIRTAIAATLVTMTLVGCSPPLRAAPLSVQPSPTFHLLPATARPSPTLAVPAAQALDHLPVRLQESCQPVEFKAIEDLQLPASLALAIQRPGEVNTLLLIGAPWTGSPQVIFDPERQPGWFGTISPDGKWLLTGQHTNPGKEGGYSDQEVWIHSIVGTHEWRVATLKYSGTRTQGQLTVDNGDGTQHLLVTNVQYGPAAGWYSDHEVRIRSQDADSPAAYQSYPVVLIDIFTGQLTSYFDSLDLYEAIRGEWYLGRYQIAGEKLDLYFTSSCDLDGCAGQFFFYSPSTQGEVDAFPWLNSQDWMPWYASAVSRTSFWQDSDGLMNVLVRQRHGLDLALGLSLEELQSHIPYQQAMSVLEVPPGEGLLPGMEDDVFEGPHLDVNWISRDGHLILLARIGARQTTYYLADLRKLVLTELCQGPFSPISHYLEESFDRRYLAWDAWREDTSDLIIYDLITSQAAVVPDAEFIGWVDLGS